MRANGSGEGGPSLERGSLFGSLLHLIDTRVALQQSPDLQTGDPSNPFHSSIRQPEIKTRALFQF